jgi:hypothetical protein
LGLSEPTENRGVTAGDAERTKNKTSDKDPNLVQGATEKEE